MKKFDILRYLQRFFALVLAVTMAGTVVVYWYCKNNQTYTASVNIKYLHDGIKDGFAPDGTAMNVDEIYSSKVISQAMESLGLQSGINLVRSHCTVEELIPDDQKALQEALIDKGEESTYFPDEYKVRRLFCFPRVRSTRKRFGLSSLWKIWICPNFRMGQPIRRSRSMCWSIPG